MIKALIISMNLIVFRGTVAPRRSMVLAIVLLVVGIMGLGAQGTSRGRDTKQVQNDSLHMLYNVSAYYAGWNSHSPIVRNTGDVIAGAKDRRSVYEFRIAKGYGVGPDITALFNAEPSSKVQPCAPLLTDVLLVFIIKQDRRADTLSFGVNYQCMYVNGRSAAFDSTVFIGLVEYLPYLHARPIIDEVSGSRRK